MIAAMILAIALAADPASPPATSKPAPFPAAVVKLGIQPFTLEAHDASYETKLQNARNAGTPDPEKLAEHETELHRISEYPGSMKIGQKKRLYRLELQWIERERARRQFGVAGVDARRVTAEETERESDGQ